MMLHSLKLLNKEQRGFTLIEMMIVIAIMGIISIPITMSVYQVFNISAQSTANLTVIQEVQNASDWLSRDAKMAQTATVVPTSGSPLESFQLTWLDWDGITHVVDYSINVINGVNQLHRTENGEVLVLMHNVDLTHTSCINNADGTIAFVLTASISEYRSASETRTFIILRRSGR